MDRRPNVEVPGARHTLTSADLNPPMQVQCDLLAALEER
jgi:hypothetical protein